MTRYSPQSQEYNLYFLLAALMIIGVNHALLWGFPAFFLNYGPSVGSAVVFLAINTGVGSILEPRIIGKGLGLSADGSAAVPAS